jgi:TFIIF-interacting CTD phosphatase-like protein
VILSQPTVSAGRRPAVRRINWRWLVVNHNQREKRANVLRQVRMAMEKRPEVNRVKARMANLVSRDRRAKRGRDSNLVRARDRVKSKWQVPKARKAKDKVKVLVKERVKAKENNLVKRAKPKVRAKGRDKVKERAKARGKEEKAGTARWLVGRMEAVAGAVLGAEGK